MRTLLPTKTLDTTALEDLDFEPVLPPCEHPQHPHRHRDDDLAALVVRVNPCPGCGEPGVDAFLLCQSGWDLGATDTFVCDKCGHETTRDVAWTVLRRVR